METCHGSGRDETRSKDFHSAVETIIYDEIVRHSNTVGFHWVSLAVVIIAHLGIVEVRDAAVGGGVS